MLLGTVLDQVFAVVDGIAFVVSLGILYAVTLTADTVDQLFGRQNRYVAAAVGVCLFVVSGALLTKYWP